MVLLPKSGGPEGLIASLTEYCYREDESQINEQELTKSQ